MPAAGKILIVDDDPTILEALSAALAPPNEVLTAQSGLRALEIAGQHSVDLVLLDYLLPDVSGLTVLRSLRQACPPLPVILMTGFGSEDVAVEAFRSGVQDYLKKPIRPADLIDRVGALLACRGGANEPGSAVWHGPSSAEPAESQGPPNGPIRRAVAFIDAHLDRHLSLEEVAREAGMSKFHFCRYFKADTGLSFREFLAHRRIARAAELLREGNRRVSEVYLDVGFKDLSHFGRVFRKVTGQPPSRYRRGNGIPT